MFAYRGIAVDTWVRIEGSCPIKWEADGGQARFAIGPDAAVLNLAASEQGLQKLVIAASEALHAMQAQDDQNPTSPQPN